MIRVGDIMSKNPVVVDKTMSVRDSARLMATNRVGALLVAENGQPIGIVTETDFTRKVVGGEVEITAPVGNIMTTPIFSARPEADLIQVASTMQQNHIKKIPIMEGKQVLGIVTQTDVVKNLFTALRDLQQEYSTGNLSSQQFVEESGKLFHDFHSALSKMHRNWHMQCKNCGNTFMDPEYDGKLSIQQCPKCNSSKIEFDQHPAI